MYRQFPLFLCLSVFAAVAGWSLTPPRALAAGEDQLPERVAAEWKALKAEHPGMWVNVRDGRVTRIYGDVALTGRTAEATRDAFLAEFLPALGVSPAEVVISGPQDVMRGKFTAYYLSHVHHGVPVEGSYATVVIRNELANKLVLASTALTPSELLPQETTARLSAEGALAVVQELVPEMPYYGQPELLYRVEGDTARLTYTVIVDNLNRAERFKAKYYVDANSGQVVDIKSMILHTDVYGHCEGYATPPGIYPDEPGHEPVIWDLADLRVEIIGENSAYTDLNGDYVIAHDGSSEVTVFTDLRGQWVNVNNQSGGDLSLWELVIPPGPVDFLLNDSPAEYGTAQVNGFIHTEIVHDFAKAQNPSYPGIDSQLPCYVNIYDVCNAYYDYSSINFFRAGSGCVNTAYASVIYHEYGHHIVAKGHGGATGDYHEGTADAVSCLILNSPIVGRDFSGPGSYIRNVDTPNVQYPCSGGVHYCGQVLGGAIWDTKKELAVTEGNAQALAICADYAINSILFHPEGISPDITVDWLTLDDDNGDIGDGTPHYAEIAAGFGNHNLDAPELNPLAFAYPNGRPETVLPEQTTTVRVEVGSLTSDPQPDTGMVYYRVDGGSFTSAAMEVVSENVYDATLPAADCLSTIEWYVSAETTGGTTIYNPMDAPTTGQYFTALSAASSAVEFDDDMESDQGWSVGDPSDPDDAVAGIWNRMDPEETTAQPEDDHTANPATICWVTDGEAGIAPPGSNDVDGGKTTLMSPVFDLSDADDALISYWRWYCNDAGHDPNNDIFTVDISNSGGSAGSWINVESIGPAGEEASGEWFFQEFRVSQLVTLSDQVQIRFVASDYGESSVVEAAVDDFLLTILECESTPECPGDLDGDGFRNATDFTLFANAYGSQIGEPNYNPEADFNGDGFVNLTDFTEFAAVYLVPCP